MKALILIDIQKGFTDPVWGTRNNPSFESNVARILVHWRRSRFPIYHVQHLSLNPSSPLRPGQDGVDFIGIAQPKEVEPVIQKQVHSAFIGTSLEADLKREGIHHLVLVGLTSDHCVSTTARMGCDLGFSLTVVSDAVATFDRIGAGGHVHSASEVQAVSLASLNGEFASVVSTECVLRP